MAGSAVRGRRPVATNTSRAEQTRPSASVTTRSATLAFTWQKELELGNGPTNDAFNIPVNKNISGSSQPLVTAIGLSYQTPAVSGNRFVRAVVRDWTVGSFFRLASGLPIPTPSANNNLNLYLFQSTRQNR
jgi:hypothetical protein